MGDPIHTVVVFFNGYAGKYMSVCKCGWEGPNRDDEARAEKDGRSHYVPPRPIVVYG